MAGNWVSLHRKLLRHPIMTHDGLCRLWIYCLMRANWKPKEWIIPGTMKPIVVERGSFITGRESLFNAMYPARDSAGNAIKRDSKPTSRTVWRWLTTLQSLDCVKLENVSNRCTLVTICKYDTYQSERKRTCPADKPTDVPLIDQPVSTIEQGNNNSNKVKQEVGAADAATSEKPAKEIRAEEVPLPAGFDSPEFLSARDAWFAMRRRRKFSVKPAYVSGWYEKLLPLGHQRAADCLRHSADNEYQGVFPEKFTNGNGSNRGTASRPANTGTAPGTVGRGDM